MEIKTIGNINKIMETLIRSIEKHPIDILQGEVIGERKDFKWEIRRIDRKIMENYINP